MPHFHLENNMSGFVDDVLVGELDNLRPQRPALESCYRKRPREGKTMRIPALWVAISIFVIGHAMPALGQVDQQRAQEYFKEAQALCARDGGRLWGVSICMPMVIGDARM